LAKFAVDRIVDQSPIWFQTAVAILEKIRNQEAPGAKRSATEVEDRMMFSEPQGRQEAELGGAHEVVLLGRTDIGGVVMRTRRQGFRRVAGQGAHIVILGAVHADQLLRRSFALKRGQGEMSGCVEFLKSINFFLFSSFPVLKPPPTIQTLAARISFDWN
jgi:hypothetical protein